MAARKNMARWLDRWLVQHRARRVVDEPHRGYVKTEPIDEQQVRQQALKGRELMKDQA